MKSKIKKRVLFSKRNCFIGGVIAIIVMWNILVPTINSDFESVEDYNRIKLDKGSKIIIKHKRIDALFGSFYRDYFIYNHEYIGLIDNKNTSYRDFYVIKEQGLNFFDNNIESLSFLSFEEQDKAEGIRAFYIYKSWQRGNKQISLVRNNNVAKNLAEGQLFEENGLKYVEMGETYYFQDYVTGENVIEIEYGEKGKHTFRILSDKALAYPTIYLLFLFDTVID